MRAFKHIDADGSGEIDAKGNNCVMCRRGGGGINKAKKNPDKLVFCNSMKINIE